ncbi:hypothetical protein CYY_004406 [Polysphondylium violaceum]|uniref:phospholipase D n=1 Tax=Polysphondylium violaceum TaxID=133409 RepID=A0A8J4PUM5_9MYCE|nr:hypothetical protein CYY_004406 [Polysphondylium violaceum]
MNDRQGLSSSGSKRNTSGSGGGSSGKQQSYRQFPHHYQYSTKALQDFEDKRKLLIEQLKSVKINLDSQSEDDPISYLKIRMELNKVKASLESELKTLDEVLNTTTKIEEPISTPIDGITSLLNMILPAGTTTTTTTTTATATATTTNTIVANIQTIASTTTTANQQRISPSTTSTFRSSNLPVSCVPQPNTYNYPNSIIPTSTPLDNPDPNHPRFPSRDNINVKFYVDCDEYFAASAEAIENAQREVFITSWFLSPEVYLIRYPNLDPRYRLDNLLKRKAMQGVKIFVILWDETKIATFKGSKRAKDKLEELHQNIKVIKHPPIIPLYWSHHQKTLIVDQELAFVGGVDFCFGRYDTWCHHLIDVNSNLWPGKDYYNPVLGEMGDILAPNEDSIDRKKIPRMPWHDVMVGVNGLAARDVALNFILRWNHHKDDYYPPLYFNTTPLISQGTSTCQLLRSMDEWSGGGRNERSIHTAYIQAIEDADHYIYIENQNFVSTHAPGVWNQISHEIVKRIKRAIRKREVFRVFIVLPSQQDGKFQEETHIRGLMHWQYATLIRGENSIVRQLSREFPDVDLTEYISFFSLRTHAFLEGSYVTEQIYVHSKLMVIDDRVVIVGSANINDRSFNGERDSELAFIVRDDKDTIKTKMNGKEYIASRFAFNLRIRLWKEHLGLLPPIDHPPLFNNNINGNCSGSSNNATLLVNNNNNNDKPASRKNSYNESDNENVNSNSSKSLESSNVNNNSNNKLSTSISSSSISIPNNRKPITSHHRSSSFQGIVVQPPFSTRSNQPTPTEQSPLDSPRTESSETLNNDNSSTGSTGSGSLIIEDYQNVSGSCNSFENLPKLSLQPQHNLSVTQLPSINSSNNNNNSGVNNNNNNNNVPVSAVNEDNVKVVVVSDAESPRTQPRSISSLHDYSDDSYCPQSSIDLIDPICSDFYFGVWIGTAASNTRIYDNVFPAIPKDAIKTVDQFNQLSKLPVSLADSKLLSEVRGNLVFHSLHFLSDEDIQPTFLFTDDLFQ